MVLLRAVGSRCGLNGGVGGGAGSSRRWRAAGVGEAAAKNKCDGMEGSADCGGGEDQLGESQVENTSPFCLVLIW